ncbi:MAG: hypothetical protein KF894_04905, partial [Labilithrix sp.]|nr:hypothetical protein [Labilithrix sp.]
GCGSCAKACPWENIQMAPSRDAAAYPQVAVKCDLCKGVDGGPACVASCPTQAIARIDPNAALVELRVPGARASAPPVLPERIAAWPWVVGAGLAGVGLAALGLERWSSGALAGGLVALLLAYALGKRARRPLAGLRGRVPLSRWLYVGHLSLGALASGVVLGHATASVPPNAAGALTIAFTLAALTGALGAALGAVVPRVLARVERSSVLPEELAARPKELDERVFATLSGKSELVKTLFAKALAPYRRSTLGPAALILSQRTLREEERVVRARLDALTGGKKGEALAGVDELVRLVVEHRAARAQRVLTWALRGWLVPHLAATAAAVVLVVVHVVAVTVGPPAVARVAPSQAAAVGGGR